MSSKPSPRHLIILVSAVLAIASSGCGNNPYPPGESARNIHYVVLPEPLRFLDPVNSYRVDEGEVIDNIYNEYFKYDYLKRTPFTLDLNLGATEPTREPYHYIDTSTGKPVPKTGESWTFHIKHGLLFQDDPCFPGGKGREITGADFLYALRRMADPKNNCPVVSFIQDKIIGFDDYAKACAVRAAKKQPTDYAVPVEGLRFDPKDPYTFTILLNQPYPQLRYLMAMHFAAPIPHEAVEKYHDLEKHCVGDGQFVMSEYSPRKHIVLKANPNRPLMFYPTEGSVQDKRDGLLVDAGKRLPLADEVHYSFISERETSWLFFLQGYEDAATVLNSNYNQVVAKGEISPEMARKGISLRTDTEPTVYYFAFNMTDPVVGGYTPQKRKLRQAISTAIDSQTFIDLFEQGVGQPADFAIPPGISGYDPNYHNPYRQYNVVRAKQLLAEAGYPGGIDSKTGERLTIYYDNSATTALARQEAELIQKQIGAIGINCQLRTVRDTVWQENLDHGRYQFMTYGWSADYPDPENFLMLFYGPDLRPGPNHSGYQNPAYDRLFEKMRSMNDGPERMAVIKQMRDMLQEDCPWIFREYSETMSIHYDWLHNVKPHPIALDTMQYEPVDGVERARKQGEWNRPKYWPLLVFAALIALGSIPAATVVNQRRTRYIRKGTGD